MIVDGKVVAQNNVALFSNSDPIPEFALNTINLNPRFFDPLTFRTYPKKQDAPYAYVQAVEMYDGYFKRAFHEKLQAHPTEGHLLPDVDSDILKLVVIDRHHATTHHGTAYVRGFELKRGAIACTTNCENQNLVVLGTSDEEIAFAVKAIHKVGGGFFAVADGQVLGSVELAVAGCMSSERWETVAQKSRELDRIVQKELVGKDGSDCMKVPFMILSFVGLVGVPDLGITELGMVHTAKQELIDVVLEEEELSTPSSSDTVESARVTRVCCRCPRHSQP